MSSEKFWTEDPCILLTNIRLFPLRDMSRDEKLNAITRLSIVGAGVMYFMKYDFWFTFLLIALIAILLMKFSVKPESFSTGGHGGMAAVAIGETPIGDDDGSLADPTATREDFTLVPTYANPDMHTTTIAPLFSEEWQIYPPAYDVYVNTPPDVTFKAPLQPQLYPYGQYLTRTNLLPSDEYATHTLNGGPRQAREYVNSAFLRHSLGFRENMTRLYKKKLARRFRGSCGDVFSPFNSY